jgi:hypothetical protein
MKIKNSFCTGSFVLLLFLTASVYAQSAEPLNPFEQFIGEWKLNNSLQVFEWGPGKTSVIGKSYRISETSRTLVSEGMWFWHPGEQQIKGYVTATNMPVSFFDYTTTFENGRMISDLSAYDKKGNKSSYKELMELTSDSTYKWTLMQQGEVVMERLFRRK